MDTCRLLRSSFDDVSKQSEGHAPALPVAIERGSLLIDMHDQPDAMLQIAIDEAHIRSATTQDSRSSTRLTGCSPMRSST